MDIEELSKSLNAHNVEFVIIGATAFPIHGYARATLDIDILSAPNLKMRAAHSMPSEILAMTRLKSPSKIY
jgi:hypothetical protein